LLDQVDDQGLDVAIAERRSEAVAAQEVPS
jgi:hypothetical protein